MKIENLVREGKKSLKRGDYYTALDNFLQALDTDSENPEIHYFLGITYGRMERYDKAIKHLWYVLKSELAYIHKVHAQMILGYIYTIRNEYEQALELFNDVVNGGFESAQAYAAIGYLMDQLGNFKESVMNLYRAIEIDPKNANARNSLGYILAEANVNLNEALQQCKKAVAIDPGNPAYLDSLGWTYFKLGDIGKAKSYLKKALRLAPESKEIRKHLKAIEKNSS